MNNDDDDYQGQSSAPENEPQPGFDEGAFDERPRRLEPVFEDSETLKSFEEGVDEEEDTFESSLYSSEYDDDTIDYDVDPEGMVDDEDFDPAPQPEPTTWGAEDLKPELIREPEIGLEPISEFHHEENDDWQNELQDKGEPWPIGLIIVAAFAVLLLAAGGYGVMQQRTGMQEEIRMLQAAVATSASPDEIQASRDTQRLLTERNEELSATVESLRSEVRSLQSAAMTLEGQVVGAQTASKAKAVATPAVMQQAPPPVKKPVAAAAATGNWFVNFGSYQSETTAGSWVARLKPSDGRVVVSSGVRNGDTFYRVRVLELASRDQAETIARSLEQEYDLSKLWIGEQ